MNLSKWMVKVSGEIIKNRKVQEILECDEKHIEEETSSTNPIQAFCNPQSKNDKLNYQEHYKFKFPNYASDFATLVCFFFF